MDIVVSSSGWQTVCGGASSGGGGTTSPTPSPTPSPGGNSRSFWTWTGNGNGEVVLDATDEHFRFYVDNGCIYSDNTGTEYTNFCLSGYSVSFLGSTYNVTKVRATDGSCIMGLLTSDGYYADIFTASGRIETITRSAKRPAAC
jgi:hypothetical protein